MTPSDGRLVWISNAQRDAAARECTSTSYGLNTLMHLFDAAPSDPAEAIANALSDGFILHPDREETYLRAAHDALDALGVSSPHAANKGET